MQPLLQWWQLIVEGGYQRYLQSHDYTEDDVVKAEKVAHWRQLSGDLQGVRLPADRTLMDEVQALNLLMKNLGSSEVPCVGDGSLLCWRQYDIEERHLEGPLFGVLPPSAA